LQGLQVLVVDDDDDARHLLCMILQACGCAVRSASSAAMAMTQLQQQAPDVLVSDIGMPEEDGYSLMERIRKLPTPQGVVPAIALTAYTRAEEQQRVLAVGYHMHMAKPVEPARLVAAIASLAAPRLPLEVVQRSCGGSDNERA
jgi:CheY-like chemotaxis protein